MANNDFNDFTPADMEAAGKALYGERWQSALAHSLSVDPRRVRQWMAGERKPQPGVMHDIIGLLEANRKQTAVVIRRLQKKYGANMKMTVHCAAVKSGIHDPFGDYQEAALFINRRAGDAGRTDADFIADEIASCAPETREALFVDSYETEIED